MFVSTKNVASVLMAMTALTAQASAQATLCTDLVDDFSAVRPGVLPGDTIERNFNLLGGDYGTSGPSSLTYSINPANKTAVIHAEAATNFWFAKFDAGACFDLTNYVSLSFDVVLPAGASFLQTLTQKLPDCSDRTPGQSDSVYVNSNKYITANGQKQTVTVPFSDFAQNIAGQPYDMKHLKDWTLVNLAPAGTTIEISNFQLQRNCKAGETPNATGAVPSAIATATTTASGTATTVPSTSGAPGSTTTPSSANPPASSTTAPATPSGTVDSGAESFARPAAVLAGAAAAAAAILL
ncbi:hypothetical protein DFS34DRAFT_673222 [Phlyctochytrium arcticum]|nr:hypothetical protein DFS34DRAFT_673222 [Phlyctochytrium arcticum]